LSTVEVFDSISFCMARSKEMVYPGSLGLSVSRRTVIGLLIVGTVTTLAGLEAEELAIPSGPEPSPKPVGYPPLWIESQVTQPLVQADKGHYFFLREEVFKNPEIVELTRGVFSYLKETKKLGVRAKLGNILLDTIQNSAKMFKRDNQSDENVDLEVAHAATVAFAAAGMGMMWWSGADLHEFGLAYDEIADFWKENGLGLEELPTLFAMEDNGSDKKNAEMGNTPHLTGQDRFAHFSNHMFLTFEYLYMKKFDPKRELMPRGLQHLISLESILSGSPTVEQEALALSFDAGHAYEIITTKDLENLPFLHERGAIGEGMGDLGEPADIKGNTLGALSGVDLFKRCLLNEPVTPLLAKLNDPRYLLYQTTPEL